MGLLSDLRGRKAYLDTNVFIYAVEEVQGYAAAVDQLLGLIEEGTITAFERADAGGMPGQALRGRTGRHRAGL
jgi:hypothetical protein